MEKRLLQSLFIVLIITLLFGCNSKTIKTETLTLNEKYTLTDDSLKGVLKIEISFEMPKKYTDAEVLTEIRNNIIENTLGVKFVKYANNEILKAFAKEMEDEYRGNNLSFVEEADKDEDMGYAFDNEYQLETFSLQSDKHIYSYGKNLYVYMGGAHGLGSTEYFNYDLKTGILLKEFDLFTEGYNAVLTNLIKHAIISQNDDVNSLNDLNEMYWANEIKPNGNFYITTEGINYMFNPYEIAPYVMGQTEVELPYADLKGIIKEDSPIAYMLSGK